MLLFTALGREVPDSLGFFSGEGFTLEVLGLLEGLGLEGFVRPAAGFKVPAVALSSLIVWETGAGAGFAVGLASAAWRPRKMPEARSTKDKEAAEIVMDDLVPRL